MPTLPTVTVLIIVGGDGSGDGETSSGAENDQQHAEEEQKRGNPTRIAAVNRARKQECSNCFRHHIPHLHCIIRMILDFAATSMSLRQVSSLSSPSSSDHHHPHSRDRHHRHPHHHQQQQRQQRHYYYHRDHRQLRHQCHHYLDCISRCITIRIWMAEVGRKALN